MALATVSSVQERLYAINRTIAGVTASRVYPGNLDSAKLPLLFTLPRQRRASALNARGTNTYDDRTYELVLVVGTWLQQIPTQSVQLEAERLIDVIIDAYAPLKRLQLNGVPLDGVVEARMSEDTGLQPERTQSDYAAVYFPLLVTTLSARGAECA